MVLSLKSKIIIGTSIGIFVLVVIIVSAVLIGVLCSGNDNDNSENEIDPDSTDYVWKSLSKGDDPLNNPLKGFVTWSDGLSNTKLKSTGSYYGISFDKVMVAENTTDFTYIEECLNRAKKNGRHAMIRLVLDNHEKKQPPCIPDYIKNKIEIKSYVASDGYTYYSPDYDDEYLIQQVGYFVKQFGEKYDDDPRIGFIFIGTVGFWGEWHTSGAPSGFMPTSENQDRYMKMWDDAFNNKMIMHRRPDPNVVPFNFGFHDDMFPDDSISEEGKYSFQNMMRNSNSTERWKKFVIGGEDTPGNQLTMYDTEEKYKLYLQAEEEIHPTFMISANYFALNDDALNKMSTQLERRNECIRRMGYNYYISEIGLYYNGGKLYVSYKIKNTGVAPFYYKWKVYGYILDDNSIIKKIDTNNTIENILPEETKQFKFELEIEKSEINNKYLGLQVPNELETGQPLLFANNNINEDGIVKLTKIQIN